MCRKIKDPKRDKSMIELPDIDLVEFIHKVYELSKPQGLGFLQFSLEDRLSKEEAKAYIIDGDSRCCLSMDYVRGRACKMTVFCKDGKRWVQDTWYDHTHAQYKELLGSFGVKLPVVVKEHGFACNCIDCQVEKRL